MPAGKPKGHPKTGGRPNIGRIRSTVSLKEGCHEWVRTNKEVLESWWDSGLPLPLPPKDVTKQ